MYRRTRLRIDIPSLRHNLELLKTWTGEAFFCPMVKANAYGHGMELVARAVEDTRAQAMGVALVEEGLRLREAGIKLPILTFAPLSSDSAQAALKACLTPVIGRLEDIHALEKARDGKDVYVHLKFNTGMQRLGFDDSQIEILKKELSARPWLRVEASCTHLTHGEEAAQSNGPTSLQFKKLRQMAMGFPGFLHAHKSASLASLRERTKDSQMGARPGIGIYGLPHEGRLVPEGLRPVMTWTTEVIQVHSLEKGESVSYSARWTASRRSRIGVLPLGYGDGYMRALSNSGVMLCRGRRVPVVGSVCMDYTLIDLTDIEQEGAIQPGEPVVILGRQGQEEMSAGEIAEKVGTIAYEIVTSIGSRVAREAV